MNEMITAVSIFEELRFVWELFAAELILLFPFAKIKGNPAIRITAAFAVLGSGPHTHNPRSGCRSL